MGKPSPKRLQEIRKACDTATGPFLVYCRELLAKSDENETTIDQLLKNYQDLHHDFAVMCEFYHAALKKLDDLKKSS